MRRLRPLIVGFSLAAIVSAPAVSAALVNVGAISPPARVTDADGNTFDFAGVRGKPVLVVYEDKESATLNTSMKAELARLARGDRYRNAIALVPVADVRTYDYWPVRGFVKSAIRSESKKIGATIYCDWDGGFGRSLGIQHGTSTVVLVGKSGRVIFAQEGKMNDADTRRLIDLLRADVET